MNKRLVAVLFLLILIFSLVLAVGGEHHCWRQDIGRYTNISLTKVFSKLYTDPDVGIIVPMDSTLTLSGFKEYVYQCENGASGSSKNYIEVQDDLTGAIIATNGDQSTGGGPHPVGSTKMCMVPGQEAACYIENGVRYPGQFECESGSFFVGGGLTDSIIIPMTQYKGAQKWTVYLGTISPAGAGIVAGSPKITRRALETIEFTVDSSKPALLVFPPTPLQKMNTYTMDGNIEKEVYFTLLNKSKVPSIINSYSVDCPAGVTCELDKANNGENMFNKWSVGSNQALMIPVKYTINKNAIPLNTVSRLVVKYTPSGFSECASDGCTATSSFVKFESGFLDEQKFQINVSNQVDQKYCIDYEGHLGRTGADYAPRVNLYFGGNVPSTSTLADETLVSLNECSPVDYATSEENPNWVYCSQSEFLVELAGRISLYSDNLTNIKNKEMIGDFASAAHFRSENGRLKEFNVYLREQDLNKEIRNNSVQELLTALSNSNFSKIGFSVGNEGMSDNKFKTLINGMELYKTANKILLNDTKVTPGEYKITLDINDDLSKQSASGLFVDDATLNRSVKVYIEKVAEPKMNWFVYYAKDNYDSNMYLPTTPDAFTTNYLDRGTIMNFEKNGNSTTMNKFYSTWAIPLIVKITDKGASKGSDSSFVVDGDQFKNSEVFSVWTGFASSLGNGCETTKLNATSGKKALPYRVLDSNLGNNWFEINDLNEVAPNSKMYLETVIYLPTNVNTFQMEVPFSAFTLDSNAFGTADSKASLTVPFLNYGSYTVDSLKEVFEGVKNQNLCVYYDNSTDKEVWKIFWNQDKALDDLKAIVKPQMTDATICESRELLSS